MRLGQGDHRIPHAGPERGTQSRVAELLHRRQPRHPRIERLRAQGRRRGPHDADAGRGQFVERAGQRMQRGQRRGHAPRQRPQRPLRSVGRRGSQAAAPGAGRHRAEGPQDLEDRRQAGGAARHARQGRWFAGLRHGLEAAQHVERRDQGLPGIRRQDQELRCRRGGQAPRRQEGGAGGRQRRRSGGRHLVARQDRTRCAADPVGRRPQRQDLELGCRANAQGRPYRRRCGVGQQGGRREGRARRRGAHDRSGVLVPAPEPRLHGGDERHRALHTRTLRGVVPHAKRRGRVRRHRRSLGPDRRRKSKCTRSTSAVASAAAA